MLIFSVYLFLLPGIACAGEDNCKDEQEHVTAKTNDHDNQEKGDCDNFCSCSCCVHIVSVNMQTRLNIIEKPEGEITKHAFYDNSSLPTNYFGNIWQPPRTD